MWILRSFSLCFSSFNLTEAGFLDGVFLKVPSPEQGLAKCQEWRSCESMMPMLSTSFKFPENLSSIWKDIEGSVKLSIKNTSKCCTAKNKGKDSAWKNVKEFQSVRFRAHSFFIVFSSWVWDTSHSTRSKRKISRTSEGRRPTRSATNVVSVKSSSRARRPGTGCFAFWRSQTSKNAMSFSTFFMWTNIVEPAPIQKNIQTKSFCS